MKIETTKGMINFESTQKSGFDRYRFGIITLPNGKPLPMRGEG
jgi:hypothetical protein